VTADLLSADLLLAYLVARLRDGGVDAGRDETAMRRAYEATTAMLAALGVPGALPFDDVTAAFFRCVAARPLGGPAEPPTTPSTTRRHLEVVR
jgi:hypothetical protein